MLARVIWTIVLLGATSQLLPAQDDPAAGPEALDRFLTYYYMEKNTVEVSWWLKQLQASELLDSNEGTIEPIVGFLAVVFEENPTEVTRIARSADFTGKTRDAVMRALWLSGHGDKIAEVFGKSPAFAKKKRVSLKVRPIKHAGDLDMLWGAFMASGDSEYVKRIIDVVDKKHPFGGDEKEKLVTRGAAEWSLKSNMMQHELVYRAIREQAESRSGTVQKTLKKMLASAKPSSTLAHSEGGFSAMLVVMDESSLREFTNERPRISQKTNARRGDIIAIKIVFMGIELAEDLTADVKYDLKFLDPDGEIYDETDLTGLEALSRRVPTRFRIFNNQDVVAIRFEPEDKLGTYKIIAKIQDKISGKAVLLEGKIELQE